MASFQLLLLAPWLPVHLFRNHAAAAGADADHGQLHLRSIKNNRVNIFSCHCLLTFFFTGSLTGNQSRAGLLLCCCSQGGMYLLQLLDHHVCSGTTLLLLALCQSISIGWVYGESGAT